MITPTMTHQLGAATKAGIDLHLGQKPKLGGRYADDSLIYISYYDLACSPLLVDILADVSDSKREYLCSIVGSCLW
jgi:hypothetical protein